MIFADKLNIYSHSLLHCAAHRQFVADKFAVFFVVLPFDSIIILLLLYLLVYNMYSLSLLIE